MFALNDKIGQYPRGNGAIRLVGNGATTTAGRVQVYYNGRWGNICRRTTFSTTAANVVCHQLGYTNAMSWSYASVDK